MKRFTRFTSVFGGCALLVFATQAFGDTGAVCGAAAHWVDSCPGGLYSLSTTSNFNYWLDTNSTGLKDGGDSTGFIQTTGTTKIYLGPPGNGTTHQILSEVYDLSETGGGATIIAGDGIADGTSNNSLYSPGAITERGYGPGFCDPTHPLPGQDPSLADSCYNVRFQLTVGSLVLYNHEALNVVCQSLTGVPPYGCQYKWQDKNLLLYDTPFGTDGTVLGGLLPADAAHHSVPEPAAALLLVGNLLALGALIRRRRLSYS